ncbi:MAG TPA: hypothetical protein VHL09_00950, partial [Dehalococcoidia bacterium]|nr:hypothetical protein [Dehalococcoidia bacterium]
MSVLEDPATDTVAAVPDSIATGPLRLVPAEPGPAQTTDQSTGGAPSQPSRTARRVLIGLIVTAAIIFGLLVADRRALPRPRVEIRDEGGQAALEPADLDLLRTRAADLPYPVTIVLADRPPSRGAWERSLNGLAQPDRLAIGIGVGERWAVVSRGADLPLPASEELAIQAAAQSALSNGEPGRGALLALAQAQLLGDPRPPARGTPPLDPAKLRLVGSILAPVIVLLCCLIGIRRRFVTH